MSSENVELVREAFAGGLAETAETYWHPEIEADIVTFEHLWAYVVEVREERIAYFRAYYEPREALEAAGLRE